MKIKENLFQIFGFYLKKIKLFKELFKGLFYGFLMPSMVGGDFYYIYRFGKNFNNYTKITVGIFFIKLIGFCVFLINLILLLIFNWGVVVKKLQFISFNIKLSNDLFLFFIATIFILLIIFLLLLNNKKFLEIFKSIKERLFIIKSDLVENKKQVIKIIIFSFLFYFVSVGSRVTLGKIIGINLNIFQLGAVILLVNFLVILPISISGIGVREASYITLMGLFGIPTEIALIQSFMDFLISISGVCLGGIFLFIDNLKGLNIEVHKNKNC